MTTVIKRWGVLLVLAAHCASAADAGSFESEWHRARAQYEQDLRTQGAVGSSLVITQHGQVLKAVHFGYADKQAQRPVDADTIFHWASITKMFTAVAVLQLRDRGKLSLDDRVVDYLPEFKEVHDPYGPISAITLRHLITHSSGLRAPTFPWRGDSQWAPLEPAKWSQVATMMPYSEIEFAPGSRFSYSNLGLSMLGRIVEEITAEDVEIYITKNILMPLGMTRSYFDTTPYHLRAYRSNNYYLDKGQLTANGPEVETGATVANGGLNGPVGDLLKFAHFLLGVGDEGNYDTVLSRASIAEMHQPLFDAADETLASQKMGMSSFVIDQPVAEGGALRFIGHTGGQVGFSSFVYIQPETTVATVFVVNTRDEAVNRKDTAFARTRAALFNKVVPALRSSIR